MKKEDQTAQSFLKLSFVQFCAAIFSSWNPVIFHMVCSYYIVLLFNLSRVFIHRIPHLSHSPSWSLGRYLSTQVEASSILSFFLLTCFHCIYSEFFKMTIFPHQSRNRCAFVAALNFQCFSVFWCSIAQAVTHRLHRGGPDSVQQELMWGAYTADNETLELRSSQVSHTNHIHSVFQTRV